jgi:hypothetical protein
MLILPAEARSPAVEIPPEEDEGLIPPDDEEALRVTADEMSDVQKLREPAAARLCRFTNASTSIPKYLPNVVTSKMLKSVAAK